MLKTWASFRAHAVIDVALAREGMSSVGNDRDALTALINAYWS
jgi:hypothetical protein